VVATVSIKGVEGKTKADPVTGRYTLKGLKAGLLSVVVEAEGYRKRVVPAMVEQGKTAERNIKLTAEREKSWVNLSATDRRTGGPVASHVRFEGASFKEAMTDSTGVLERFEITPGKYTVFFDAPGYLRMAKGFTVGSYRTEGVSVSLLPMGATLVVSGVSFVPSTGNLKVESDEGIREAVSLIESNPGMRFEIGVHTDNRGPREENLVLSEKRAQIFKRFIVNGFNLDADRLTTRGYGEEEPVADNSTEEGRKKNRRIEIKALKGTE